MAYAVELLLDATAAEAVRGIWRRLADAGLPAPLLDLGIRPHVTLAVYEDLDPARLLDALGSFAAEEPPEPVSLASVGAFPGEERVVFLAPVVTRGLLALHAGFHERFADLRERASPLYLPGGWVPHVTLSLAPDDDTLGRVLRVAREEPLPILGGLDRLEVLAFERGARGPVKVLQALPLEP